MDFDQPVDLEALFQRYKEKNSLSFKDPFAETCDSWEQWADVMDFIDWKHCKEDWFVPEGLMLREIIELQTWIDI